MPSSGQRAATMPTRDRFQDGDPRADRRVSYTPTGQVRINPYTPLSYRRPAIYAADEFPGIIPQGFVPTLWQYSGLDPEQSADQGTGQAGQPGGGSYGTLGSRIGGGYGGGGRGGGGRGGGGRGGGGSYSGYGQRPNADFIPGWLQQMVNWKV